MVRFQGSNTPNRRGSAPGPKSLLLPSYAHILFDLQQLGHACPQHKAQGPVAETSRTQCTSPTRYDGAIKCVIKLWEVNFGGLDHALNLFWLRADSIPIYVCIPFDLARSNQGFYGSITPIIRHIDPNYWKLIIQRGMI